MKLSNFVVFNSETPIDWSAYGLEDHLRSQLCPPCGSQTLSVDGFVPPIKGQDALVYAVDGLLLCMYQKMERLLPPGVVADAVAERVDEIQSGQGRIVGRKERSELKDNVVMELLPRAFTQSKQTPVIIDTKRARVLVACGSVKQSETVTERLRDAVETLPIMPAIPDVGVETLFANWLESPNEMPEGLTLGDKCELTGDEGAKIKYTAIALPDDEVRSYLESGLLASRLELVWNDELAFELTDKFQFKQVKAIEDLKSSMDAAEYEDDVESVQGNLQMVGTVLRDTVDVVFEAFDVDWIGDETRDVA